MTVYRMTIPKQLLYQRHACKNLWQLKNRAIVFHVNWKLLKK